MSFELYGKRTIDSIEYVGSEKAYIQVNFLYTNKVMLFQPHSEASGYPIMGNITRHVVHEDVNDKFVDFTVRDNQLIIIGEHGEYPVEIKSEYLNYEEYDTSTFVNLYDVPIMVKNTGTIFRWKK